MQPLKRNTETPSFINGRESLLGTGALRDWGYQIAQRLMDIVVSVCILTLSLPILLIIAAVIKVASPGPVLFKHTRTGINRRKQGQSYYGDVERRRMNLFGKQFALYKFRTMYADSRSRFPELYTYNYSQEEIESLPIKILVGKKNNAANLRAAADFNSAFNDDPRITQIGRWLRRTSLDELPNFINVLTGDMHLTGPRPDIVENIRYYPEPHLRKLEVKPGVTGLAQIKGRGKLSLLQTNECDLEYVNSRCLWLDLKILFKTMIVGIKREGAF